MTLILWIILGLFAGLLAKWFIPCKESGGLFITLLLGISGALVGGYISAAFGWGSVSEFSAVSLLISLFGAILTVFIYRNCKR